MESKNESIQLTRICITTTFPVSEKSIFFKKRSKKEFPLDCSCIVHLWNWQNCKKNQSDVVLTLDRLPDSIARWRRPTLTFSLLWTQLPWQILLSFKRKFELFTSQESNTRNQFSAHRELLMSVGRLCFSRLPFRSFCFSRFHWGAYYSGTLSVGLKSLSGWESSRKIDEKER